jgi:hypothetical protein
MECTDDSHCGDGVCVNNVCVDCRVNNDCPSAKPFCEDLTCIQCRNSADCPDNGLFCDGDEICDESLKTYRSTGNPCNLRFVTRICRESEDRCVQCESNEDCINLLDSCRQPEGICCKAVDSDPLCFEEIP